MLLNENHYRVSGKAADGEKAVELCAVHQPDIAFVDIDMPRLDGHRAAQKIREACPATQVVMVSSLATRNHVQQAMESGASGFVVKPFTSKKVNQAIEQCIRKMSAGKQLK